MDENVTSLARVIISYSVRACLQFAVCVICDRRYVYVSSVAGVTSCRRAAATMCPAPLLPVGAEGPRAAEQTAT